MNKNKIKQAQEAENVLLGIIETIEKEKVVTMKQIEDLKEKINELEKK